MYWKKQSKAGVGKRRNVGSIIVEFTLLMPFFLLCVYLYIMAFLYYIEAGKGMSRLAESIYDQREEDSIEGEEYLYISKRGGNREGTFRKENKWTVTEISMKRDISDPVRNLRRWQIIADTIH